MLLLLLSLLQCKHCSLCMCNIVCACMWLLVVGGMCLSVKCAHLNLYVQAGCS